MDARQASGGKLDWLIAADGRRLCLHDWPLAGAQAGVLFVHGLGEHAGRYGALAAWFNARGYAVRSYDQRGHGRSPGQRGALSRPLELLEDLAQVYGRFAAMLEAPTLVLGHSMGGLVALRAVLDGYVVPRALVLSSPALRTWTPAWEQVMARRLARILPNLPLRSGLPFEALSQEAAVVAAYRHDPLRSGWITPRLARFIFESGPHCIARAAQLAVPTLLLAAGADRLVDVAGSRAFATAAEAGGWLTTRLFDGLFHELFNEAQPARGEVLAQLSWWLQVQGLP
ncbi:alpha/beta hydrolase [Frateuria terrea]|uniref:Lysophospholipase, alpha-beta hydrolase superfamily n=1 Tax=Frateuria terrea TaxID=529704 RepID=A0A1H6SYH0_9GAMM|nr:alpha/beta hydrolase [Frateuria terrea]SEI69050.1 Lysophospholipase, alpha-beta hydrolase superfamily [Frateuria terrea]SFP27383.1 Lysophospholipase, alpha-beta hydrolase superfamily [Frateuria terrea]